ncbi:MAG: AAA family ATPase, partial [Nitrospirae bacterium]
GTEINFLDETLTEIRLPGEDGKHMFITFKFVPLKTRDESGQWKAFVFKDISLMKDLEDELKTRKRQSPIVTRSPRMRQILELVGIIANSNATVLIQGETGTGKELIAEAIHYQSDRKNHPLIKVNCSALPENLLEDELFGHVKGAFTSAYTDKKGRFELADGGSIFLDEIGELSPHLQVKLLRVLQHRSFERLGSGKTITVDVRVISATNKNLKEEVEKGNFRADLYYRLNVVSIELPPLREKKEDIPVLVNHFLNEFAQRGYRRVKGVSSQVMEAFFRYHWPGNVRELENAIEHALVCSRDEVINLSDLPLDIQHSIGKELPEETGNTLLEFKNSSRKPYKKVSAEECLDALRRAGGNKALAARMLGINRATLYRKLSAH